MQAYCHGINKVLRYITLKQYSEINQIFRVFVLTGRKLIQCTSLNSPRAETDAAPLPLQIYQHIKLCVCVCVVNVGHIDEDCILCNQNYLVNTLFRVLQCRELESRYLTDADTILSRELYSHILNQMNFIWPVVKQTLSTYSVMNFSLIKTF